VPAAVLDGGWDAWLASGGPVEPGADGPAGSSRPDGLAGRQPVTPREHSGMWVDRTFVLEVVAGSRPAHLVCALSAEVFAGTAPTRYSRRGHIPSSMNLPARTLQGPDGRMLSPERVAQAAAVIPDDRPVIVYCGGGISAAMVAHALTMAGRDQVAIYDGSLEEWTADPALPVDCSR
jgi:thiosulfate/3-mercaptopyruvate sulfurtransferase